MWGNNFKKPMPAQKPQKEGCKIKVNRDDKGRIRSISTNGACTKEELNIFRENMDMGESRGNQNDE